MKNTILFFALFVSFATFAQFPRKNPELLIGHEVKVKPLSEIEAKTNQGYANFYSNIEMGLRNTYAPNESGHKSRTEMLEGHTFKVVSVEPYRFAANDYYKIGLEENGAVIFYKYEKHTVGYLEPVNFTLPADYYCGYIERKVNNHGDIHYDIYNLSISAFNINKVIYKDLKVTEYSIVIFKLEGNASSYLGTIVLEFENGTSLSFPDQILGNRLLTFTIDEKQLKTLKQNTIKTIKAGGLTKDFTDHGQLFRGVINCIPEGNK